MEFGNRLFIIISLLVIEFHLVVVQASPKSYDQALMEHIFKEYNKGVRPVRTNKVIHMILGIEFIQIISVDERSQRVTLKIWMRMKWMNEMLRWNPKVWGNITLIKVNPEMVWKPDIMLYDEVDETLTDSINSFKTLVHMYPDGGTYWSSPTMFTSSCNIDVKYFPFDQQTCKLKYGSWAYDESELDMHISNIPTLSDHYINHTEWDIASVRYERNIVGFSMHSKSWVDITVYFTIDRKPLYYMMNVIVPCVILMSIILISFFLPPECGERAAIVITVLLAFTVYLHMVSQSLPTTSDSSPVLSVFYITIMAESAFSLFMTSIVLVIHHRGAEKGVRPLPNWVKYWFIDFLAKKLGVIQTNLREYSFGDLLALKQESGDETDNSKLLDKQRAGRARWKNSMVAIKAREIKTTATSVENQTLNSLLNEVTIITQLIHDMNRQDEIEEEWYFLAKVLDRLIFWGFFFMFLLTSVLILVPVYAKNH